MRLYILSPTDKIYEGNAREVVLPGEDGEVTVLDFHQPFLYCLRDGYITINEHAYKEKSASVKAPEAVMIRNGIARMKGNELVVLVEAEKKNA